MAGDSRTNMESFYPILEGNVASQWGFDAMATMDDKLHMSVTDYVQTVEGPINFNKTGSIHTFASPINSLINSVQTGINTFAGPFNATSTGVNAFAGPMNCSNTNSHTFGGPVNFGSTIITPLSNNLASLVTAEVSQLENIGAASITSAQWGYLGNMDQNVAQGSTVTFAGIDLVNTVNEFSTDTTLAGNSDTAVPTEKVVKTYSDLRALWDSDNSAVTRYWGMGPTEIAQAIDEAGNHYLTFDETNGWAAVTGGNRCWIGVHLPHGCTITEFHGVGQKSTAGDDMEATLRYVTHDAATGANIAYLLNYATTMGSTSSTGLSHVVNNGIRSYRIMMERDAGGGEVRYRSFKIVYTVVRPQP